MDARTRSRIRFAARFSGVILLLYVIVALNGVNDRVIVPFTGFIAQTTAALMAAAGSDVRVLGTVVTGRRFAIDIKNGCNAIETMMLFAAAVLAFPAPPRRKLLGLALGLPLIQLLNVVRLVSLMWLGVHQRALFDFFHIAVWQTVMILIGVGTFIAWSSTIANAMAPR